MTPTQRTLNLLRKESFTACVVERWIPQVRQRKDAFGFGDILACVPHTPIPPSDLDNTQYEGVWLIQATSGSNHAARREKAKAIPELQKWLDSGGRFAVVSWRKGGKRGERKVWLPNFEEIK
jgi:hypothetical protein